MARRDEECLTPSFRLKLALMKKDLQNEGLVFGRDYIWTCTGRLQIEQNALYAKGRKPLASVNAKMKLAGLPPITQAENRIVTWTLNKSRHLMATPDSKVSAVDFAITKNGKAIWDIIKADVDNDQISDYYEIGNAAKRFGMKWGGEFRNCKGKPQPDYPHIEDIL
jgi:hypothetical protein